MPGTRTCPACKSDAIFCDTDDDGVWMECNDCGNQGYLS